MSSLRPKILIADDQEIIRTILANFLKKHGYNVFCAEDGLEAIRLYRVLNPALVISDIKMPKINGLELLEEIKKINASAMVILVTGFGSEDILLKALRGGAINFFKKPIVIEEILSVVKKAISLHDSLIHKEFLTYAIIQEDKNFVFSPAQIALTPLINQLTLNLPCFFSKKEIVNLRVGIEEMLNNAIEHGCLGIGYNAKNKALQEGYYHKMLAELLNKEEASQKKIYLSSSLTAKAFKIKIEDEGEGFDWQALPKVTSSNLLNFNGRGILLTKIFYDEVNYNTKGNEVTLIKYPSLT